MRHHTKNFLLHSPIEREQEMMDKINKAETIDQLNDLRLLICLDYSEEAHQMDSFLTELKKRETFLKD